MSFSEIPPPAEVDPGEDPPVIRIRPPGPQSRTWLTRFAHSSAPMGPMPRILRGGIGSDAPGDTIVYSTGKGSNVLDVDGNRYVDLAAGFGALLLGHGHSTIRRVLELQASRLFQALGDVYPSDARIALGERLAKLHPSGDAQVILGQSGADAVTAAIKTALLSTGKPGVLAFGGAYHGLSYAPLAASGFRESYREPFLAQLNPHVVSAPYPDSEDGLDECLERVRLALASERIGAVLVEPVLGRGGCIVPPAEFAPEISRMARAAGALLIADEIWTGLGRSGHMLFATAQGAEPDLVCLGKGLGGGLPMSACIGRRDVMRAWRRQHEVVHTTTFAGAPLASATAIATLDTISREGLVERSRNLGESFLRRLGRVQSASRGKVTAVRGAGLMLGLELAGRPGSASALQRELLGRGYITTTGGGTREVLVLTPPLTIREALLHAFSAELEQALGDSA